MPTPRFSFTATKRRQASNTFPVQLSASPSSAELAAAAEIADEHEEIVRTFAALYTRDEAGILARLDPGEGRVFLQLVSPNRAAVLYAFAEQGGEGMTIDIGGEPLRITIEYKHMAKGLGMDPELFEQLTMQIGAKVEAYTKTVTPADYPEPSILRQLESVFGLPCIPLSLNTGVLRRFLTLTARAHADKVTPEVAAMLEAAGAKIS